MSNSYPVERLLLADQIFPGASVELTSWSIIEVAAYIMTACIPELKPLAYKCAGLRTRSPDSTRFTAQPGNAPTHTSSKDRAIRHGEEELEMGERPERQWTVLAGEGTGSATVGSWQEQSLPPPATYYHARRWLQPQNSLRLLDVPGVAERNRTLAAEAGWVACVPTVKIRNVEFELCRNQG